MDKKLYTIKITSNLGWQLYIGDKKLTTQLETAKRFHGDPNTKIEKLVKQGYKDIQVEWVN